MAGNIVKICVDAPCARYRSLGDEGVTTAAEFIVAQGDVVGFNDKCQQVCEFAGALARKMINVHALCVVAGEPYGIPNKYVDQLGMSGIIGDFDGELSLRLLNQRPYPPANIQD